MSSHTITFPLITEPFQEDRLQKRFWMARQVYNRVLQEWLDRRRAYYKTEAYRKAHELADEKERKAMFFVGMQEVGFLEEVYQNQIPASLKNELFAGTDMAYHLSAEMIRRIGAVAVETVFKFHRRQIGAPDFKSGHHYDLDIKTIKANNSLKFSGDVFEVGGVRGGVGKLKLRVDLSKWSPKVAESVSRHKPTSQCILKREPIGASGEMRYFAQLSCDGHSPIAPSVTPKKGVVGVDVGVRCIAAVSDEDALLDFLCDPEKLAETWRRKQSLDRKIDHKRRLNNPEAYDEKGVPLRGVRTTRSNRHQQARHLRNEMERVGREERKRQHYALINRLLEMGNVFIVEDNTYKGWQAGLFGRQVRDFAPASFVQKLSERAAAAGGAIHKISTWNTYLSQRCHCGARVKKTLSDRHHGCECGVAAQRDLYSAFLARHIDVATGELNAPRAQKAWGEAGQLLREAFNESEVVKGLAARRGSAERL